MEDVRHARHECGEHGRDRVGGIAENLRKHARPDHLIDQPRSTGKEETKQTDEKQPILFGTRITIRHINLPKIAKIIQAQIASRVLTVKGVFPPNVPCVPSELTVQSPQ